MCNQQLKRYGAKKGAWAIVTGATDGIGKEFAFQLAKAGFNILIVARNQELLTQTAEEIGALVPAFLLHTRLIDTDTSATKYNVSTATHSIDFAKATEASYDAFAALCEGRDIGVLGKFTLNSRWPRI